MVFRFSNEDLLNPNLELPSISLLASVFKNRQFKLEILPYKDNETRDFKATCALCNYNKISKWPFNTTNLTSHFRLKHKNYLDINDTNSTSINIDSNSDKEDSSINKIYNYFSNNSNNSLKVIKKKTKLCFI